MNSLVNNPSRWGVGPGKGWLRDGCGNSDSWSNSMAVRQEGQVEGCGRWERMGEWWAWN